MQKCWNASRTWELGSRYLNYTSEKTNWLLFHQCVIKKYLRYLTVKTTVRDQLPRLTCSGKQVLGKNELTAIYSFIAIHISLVFHAGQPVQCWKTSDKHKESIFICLSIYKPFKHWLICVSASVFRFSLVSENNWTAIYHSWFNLQLLLLIWCTSPGKWVTEVDSAALPSFGCCTGSSVWINLLVLLKLYTFTLNWTSQCGKGHSQRQTPPILLPALLHRGGGMGGGWCCGGGWQDVRGALRPPLSKLGRLKWKPQSDTRCLERGTSEGGRL